MTSSSLRTAACAVTVWLALMVLGCGKGTPPTQTAERAEAAVNEMLDAWVRGESADKFTGAASSLQGEDPDWRAGSRLLSFLSIETKQNPERPDLVRCWVALTLQDRAGRKVDKKVAYDVQVGPRCVVTRAAR